MDVIRIVDYVDETTSMLESKHFEDALIQGPAILGLLEGLAMDNCIFEGSFDSTFREVPVGTVLTGVIGVRQVVFRRCRFRNVGFVAIPDVIQKFGQDFLR